MPLTKILLEFNVTEQAEIVKKILSALGFEIDETEYRRSGSYGDIFKVKGKDKVVKLTTSKHEIEALETIKGKKFDNVVRIYYSKPIPKDLAIKLQLKSRHQEDNNLVVMEYLEPTGLQYSTPLSIMMRRLSKNVYSGVKDARSDVGIRTYLMAMRKKISEELNDTQADGFINILETIGERLDAKDYKLFLDAVLDVIIDSMTATIQDVHRAISTLGTFDKQFIPDVINGLKELEDYDIFNDDLHMDNIMKDPRTGNYKIIDVQ